MAQPTSVRPRPRPPSSSRLKAAASPCRAALALATIGSSGAGALTIVLNASQSWTNNSSNPLTVASNVSGTGGLTTAGSIVMTGVNNYAGNTTVSSGTLQLGGGGSLTSPGNLNVNGTLDVSGSNVSVGTLSGSGDYQRRGGRRQRDVDDQCHQRFEFLRNHFRQRRRQNPFHREEWAKFPDVVGREQLCRQYDGKRRHARCREPNGLWQRHGYIGRERRFAGSQRAGRRRGTDSARWRTYPALPAAARLPTTAAWPVPRRWQSNQSSTTSFNGPINNGGTRSIAISQSGTGTLSLTNPASTYSSGTTIFRGQDRVGRFGQALAPARLRSAVGLFPLSGYSTASRASAGTVRQQVWATAPGRCIRRAHMAAPHPWVIPLPRRRSPATC